jgi:outer membrane lipoprotein-sorting protein
VLATLAAASVFTSGQTGASAQSPLPTGKEVIADHLEAIGGAAAWKAIKSMRATGTFSLPAQKMSGTLDLMTARPARMRLRVTLDGVGKIESGYDGKVGWTIDPISGPSVLSGRELTEMADDSTFDALLYGPEFVKEFLPIARENFGPTPAIKVKVVLRSGTEQFEYFDAASGVVLGFEGTRATPMGNVPTTEILSNYKLFGKVKLPTTIRQRALGFETEISIADVEFDTVPADAFDLPPVNKALIK